MTVRTFVSFEADFPTEGSPPGRELAEFIVHALRSRGHAATDPTNRENWAWDVRCTVDKLTVNSIIGFSDDGPRQWQIHTHPQRPFLQRLFGNGTAYEDQLRTFCEAIHHAIKEDALCRNIRWYEQAVFDKDHGDTWGDAP